MGQGLSLIADTLTAAPTPQQLSSSLEQLAKFLDWVGAGAPAEGGAIGREIMSLAGAY